MRFKTALILSFSAFLFASSAMAQQPLKKAAPPTDDELGIEEEMKKEAEKKKEEKPIPPIKMVFVKGGCFEMGDYTGEGDDDERPVHEVCVTDFYIAEAEVTQELFEAVMGYVPGRYTPDAPRHPNQPATNIAWNIANEFVKTLNKRTKGFYRLPTEAEWEYAARDRGQKMKWPGFNNEGEAGDYAWFVDNGDDQVHDVKQKKPNGLGLYDMAGNVWEWTEDYFAFDFYQASPKNDPYGPEMSLYRTVRGGSAADSIYKLRTTYRYAIQPALRQPNVGFRIAE